MYPPWKGLVQLLEKLGLLELARDKQRMAHTRVTYFYS